MKRNQFMMIFKRFGDFSQFSLDCIDQDLCYGVRRGDAWNQKKCQQDKNMTLW